MKILTALFVGALAVGGSMLGCSSDEEPSGAAGTSGRGTGATGGGGSGARGGSSGSGGSAGRGGSAGSAGSVGSGGSDSGTDAPPDGANECRNDTELAQCKRVGGEEGICSSLVDCSCNKCACLLAQCQTNRGCRNLRGCALRRGCCTPALTAQGCKGENCQTACEGEIAEAGDGFALALQVDACTYGAGDAGTPCTPCPGSDAGDAASGG